MAEFTQTIIKELESKAKLDPRENVLRDYVHSLRQLQDRVRKFELNPDIEAVLTVLQGRAREASLSGCTMGCEPKNQFRHDPVNISPRYCRSAVLTENSLSRRKSRSHWLAVPVRNSKKPSMLPKWRSVPYGA